MYLVGLHGDQVEPNGASWFIWATIAGVEAATYAAVNPYQAQNWVFLISAFACVIVMLCMWSRSRWRATTPTENVCIIASFAALTIWIVFHKAFLAHILVVAVVPVSFWPTWISVIKDRDRENSPAWGLWTLSDLMTLLIALRDGNMGVGVLAYILIEFTSHGSVWLILRWRTINPWRILGGECDDPSPLYSMSSANLFVIGETRLGKAVFAARPFAMGQRIARFSGRRIPARKLKKRLEGAGDRFMQIAPNEYMGPSGRIDDLFNHSCSPNTGLCFENAAIFLTVIEPIAPGDEITWDYSTTVADLDWKFTCDCRSVICRGAIAAFATLSPERQNWYLERDIVAPYLRL